jgi:hypothetical protein
MQKITIGGTQYTVKPDRDISKLIKAAKAKPKMTCQKACARAFPAFIAGKTSTAEYVRAYWAGNGFDMAAYDQFFGGRLSPMPASVYDPLIPEMEMLVEGGDE